MDDFLRKCLHSTHIKRILSEELNVTHENKTRHHFGIECNLIKRAKIIFSSTQFIERIEEHARL